MDQLTTTISPVVIDLIIAAIILLVACLRAKAGIYHCVMSVVVIILAIAVGMVGSRILTPIVKQNVWDGYYKQEVENKFDQEVELALKGTKSFTQSFKESWNNLIESFGTDKVSLLKIENDDIDYSDSDLVEKLRSLTLIKAELTVEKIVHLALFGLITAIAFLLLTMLKNLLEKVANFSIVGWLNHGLGFVLGFVEIVVIMIIIVRGASLLNITFFKDISEGTLLLNWLIGGDIPGTLTTLQNLTIDDLKSIKLEDLTTVDMQDVGNQLKELVKNIDLNKLPETVTDVVDKVDVDEITKDVKEVVDSVDVKGMGEKAKDLIDGAKDAAGSKAVEVVKDTVKNLVTGE